MDAIAVAVIAAVWLLLAVGVTVIITRVSARGEQASEMAALTREVRRADAATAARTPAAPTAIPARAPWDKSTRI